MQRLKKGYTLILEFCVVYRVDVLKQFDLVCLAA